MLSVLCISVVAQKLLVAATIYTRIPMSIFLIVPEEDWIGQLKYST